MLKIDFDIDWFTTYLAFIFGVLLVVYLFWDINYYIRTFVTIAYGRLFLRKLRPDETDVIYGICTTQDLDLMFRHMNNARFLRDADFARFSFYDRTGLRKAIMGAGSHFYQRCTNIRYRQVIPLFSSYKITTKLIYFTEDSVYLENKFITLNDGFIRAIVHCKQSITGGINMCEVIPRLMGKDKDFRLTAPEELELWIKSMEISSAKLRKKD